MILENKYDKQATFEANKKKHSIKMYLHSYATETAPMTSAKIQKVFHCSDVVVRKAVGLLRDDGEPIGSGSKGFFYARSPKQLEGTIMHLKSRIGALSGRVRALEATYGRIGGNEPQQMLDL